MPEDDLRRPSTEKGHRDKEAERELEPQEEERQEQPGKDGGSLGIWDLLDSFKEFINKQQGAAEGKDKAPDSVPDGEPGADPYLLLTPLFAAVKEAQSKEGETERSDREERPGRGDKAVEGELVFEPMGPEGKGDGEDRGNVWREYRLGFGGLDGSISNMVLPDSGKELIIGRNPDKADVTVPGNAVSRLHAKIELRDDGPYLHDLNSKNGTYIIRNGRPIEVKPGTPVKLEPGDKIRLGQEGAPELAWSKPGAPKEKFKPAGYKPDEVKEGADEGARAQADPAASRQARDASNYYLRNHEYDGRIPNGFQVVGGINQIDERGQHGDTKRPSVVVDLRAGKDPALEKFIADCQKELAHLKDRPEELAKELAKRVKAALEPAGWSNWQVDEGYMKLRRENAGGRLLLGDFLNAAARGEGAGVCNHQAILLKVAFDSFYPEDATRPKMKLVRGFCGDNPAGRSPVEAMNHAWTTLEVGGREKVFDPRQQILGDPVEARPSHQPGKEVPQLKPQEAEKDEPKPEAKPEAKPKAKVDYSKLAGKEVGYGGETWRVKEVRGGKAVLVADGMRNNITPADLAKLNVDERGQPKELRIGETYKIQRSNGKIDDGWVLVGWKDPAKKDALVLVKKEAIERSVPLDTLRKGNERLFAELEREARPAALPDKAPDKLPTAQEYGLVEGREVMFGGRKWYVTGGQEGKIEITRPSERLMGPEEYKRLNGDTPPKVGEEIWYQRSSGELKRWRVVAYDEATGNLRVRSETAYKLSVPIEQLLRENPEIQRQHKPADIQSILADPRSKVKIDCRWTDGDSGHDKYIGSVEGPNGERIKVMIHKQPPSGDWDRLRKDLAAQTVAKRMGTPELFPPTVLRDGMMVQAFVGREGENLHTYLHHLSRQDAGLRAQYRELDQRIFHMMDKVDPKLKTELARGLAFSVLLGDGDQHGQNFLVERTGPNPGDIKVVRVDTDYAFSRNKEPNMDQRPNFGGVVNGLFQYFSGKELPAEVRAEIKKLSDELNPADKAQTGEARSKFARETGLSREQVDALAERAKFLAESGKFPVSKGWRDQTQMLKPAGRDKQPQEGEEIKTVRQPTLALDIDKACQELEQQGISKQRVAAIREAYGKLVALESLEAIEALKAIADPGSGLSKAKREALADLVVAKSKDASLPLDFARLKDADARLVLETKALVDKLGKLDSLAGEGIHSSNVERIKERIYRQLAAQENPDRLAELSRVLDKLGDKGFARAYGNDRMALFAELLSIPERNALLQVPFEHFLDSDVSRETMKFAVERLKESAIGFRTPSAKQDVGSRYEYNASMAAMEALRQPLSDGTRLVFIPAGHGSQADSSGVDGVFLNAKTGAIQPVDWTTNLATKAEAGKDLWAASPDKAIVGQQVPPDGLVIKATAPSHPARMRQFVEGFTSTAPGVTTELLAKDRIPFPKFGAQSTSPSDAPELAGLREYVRVIDSQYKGAVRNDVLAELYKRSKNAIPHRDTLRTLADRLATSLSDNVESQGRRDSGITFDATKIAVQSDPARLNEVTGQPMKFIEIDLDKPLDVKTKVGQDNFPRQSIVSKVRLYEDGSIVGFREFTDSKGFQIKALELGHISEVAEAVKTRLEAVPEEGRKTRLQAEIDRLADVSAGKPINFSQPNELVKFFGEAVTQGGPLRVAAQRSRSLDDIMSKLKAVSEAEAAQIYDRTGGRTLKADAYQRILDAIKLEQEHKIDTQTAERILDKAVELADKGGVKPELARDVASLMVLKNVSETDAVKQAEIIAQLRQIKADISFDRAYRVSAAELEIGKLFPSDKARAEFREALSQGIAGAKPGEEVKGIYEHIMSVAEAKGLASGETSQAWLEAHDALEKMKAEGFGKLLGIAETADAREVGELLKLHSDRLAALDRAAAPDVVPAVAPTPVDRLNVAKGLLSEDLVGRFHEKINDMVADLRAAPEHAGTRLRNAVIDLLKGEGIEDKSLSKDRLEFVFDKDVKGTQVEYFSGQGDKAQKVIRKGSEFFLADGTTRVDPGSVRTKVTMPEALLRGNVGELSRQVYLVLMEQTNSGANDAADRAGMREFVTRSLSKHVSLPDEAGTVRAGHEGTNVSQLPSAETKPVEIAITDKGVRIAGVDRELSFEDVWRKRVEDLKAELDKEKKKEDSERSEERIRQLTAEVAKEQAFLDRLSNPAHPEHGRTVELAKERLRNFSAREADVERLSREKGGGGMRGRLVALTILASAYIAHQQKAEAAQTKEPKGGSDEEGRAPQHEYVPEPMEGGPQDEEGEGREKRHEDVPEDKSDKAKDKAPDKRQDKPPEKQREAADAGDRAQEKQNLADVPHSELTREAMLRMLPAINEAIKAENEKAKESGAVEQPLFDEGKLRQEWARGEFGPQSRKLWAATRQYLERDVIALMQQLDARGLPFPPGAPVGPQMSESGSGLRETDEMFRARLRSGDIKVDLGFRDLKPGEVPSADEVTRFINTFAWTAQAGEAWRKAFIEGQSTYIQQTLKGIEPMSRDGKPLDGWKPPKEATTEQLERWNAAAVTWIDTALRVRTYAETIAAYHHATTTRGSDWPSLQGAFKWAKLPDGATVFPDDALKDADFPGQIIRKSDGTVEVKLDLPDGVERTPENLAKIEKMERWLQKWGPQVDQVTQELMKAMSEQDRLLLWVEDGDVDRSKTIKGADVDSFKKANAALKGDASDVGKMVKMPGGEGDWRVKSVRADGGYELERVAPNGKEFNLKRYGFDTVRCDKDGKPNANGDYVQVTGYQDYLWAKGYSYNNWWGVDKVDRKVTMQPQIFHKNDFVPIIDNGRMRLMKAGNIEQWASAQETAKQTGNVVSAIVDAGMLATGLIEARAGWAAARAGGEVAMKQLAKQALKQSWWHLGLGVTGFGKQAIENNIPYGREIMKARHYAIMADLTLQLGPSSWSKGAWSMLGRSEKAMETYMAGVNSFKWYDKALMWTHKAYEGGRVLGVPLGGFPLCDYYFLAQFSDTLASLGAQNDLQKQKLVEAMLNHRMGKGADKPIYASPDSVTPEQMRKASEAAINDFASKLAPAKAEKNQASLQIDKAVAEAAKLPKDNQDRQRCVEKLLETWQKGASQAEKLAAARGLLALCKDDTGKLPEKIGNVPTATLSDAVGRSADEIRRRLSELSLEAPGSAAREQYREQLAGYFKSASSYEEKVAAAKALLELSQGGDGKVRELPAKAGLKLKELQQYLATTGEGLMKRAGEALFLEPDDPKRVELAADAARILNDSTASERDRVGAAMVLLSMRTSDDPEGKIAGTTTSARQVLSYLGDRARNSEAPEIKLVSGDILFRTARSTAGNLAGQERILASLEAQLQAKPGDAELKKQVDEAKKRIEATKEFQKSVNYNAADFARVCMEILESDKAPRELKMECIASPSGPRLAAIAEELKWQVEPALLRETDAGKRVDGLAGLYGRDAETIQKFLRDLAGNAKEDPDVRALAAQSLVMLNQDRATVNGVPLTAGVPLKIGTAGDVKAAGPGVAGEHAVMEMGKDGKRYIRDLGAPGGTWIVRADGSVEKVPKDKFAQIRAGDRVRLGDKDKGTELFFAHERLESLAMMGAQVKLNRDKPGAIAEAYTADVKNKLETPLKVKPGQSSQERVEAVVAKLRAAQAAIEMGPSLTGGDAQKHKRLVADALANCVQDRSPEAALVALAQITPEAVASMSVAKADALRETALKLIADPPRGQAGEALRQALVSRIPDLFVGATKEQKGRAQGMLESLLVPGASSDFQSRDADINYPIYPGGAPELRAAALEAMSRFNLDRAGEIGKILLLGGDYNGRKIDKDVAPVRLEAVKALEKAQPLELQETALKALRSETDPAVLSRLWNVEYGARRPDVDPVRTMRELEDLEQRIKQRAKPGLLEDGKQTYEAYIKKYGNFEAITMARREASGQFGYSDKIGDLFDPKAVAARKALIYVATRGDSDLLADLAARHLEQILFVPAFNRDQATLKKLAEELSGPLESVLLSNPQMSADSRLSLLSTYLMLKPGENGVVSKDEAAVVLARVLENELKRMPRVPYDKELDYEASVALQRRIMEELAKLPTDKVAPLLEALAHGEPIKDLDEKGRPARVEYGRGTSRCFEYDDKGELLRFTDMASGKVFERDKANKTTFRTKDGQVLTGVKVNAGRGLDSADVRSILRAGWSMGSGPGANEWLRFDRKLVQGDFGDFRYEKDGKSIIEKPNGMVIEEELGTNFRRVKMTYPGGKESREFLFKPTGDRKVEVTVTSQPDGKKEIWKAEYGYSSVTISGTGSDGKNILSIHSNSWEGNRSPVSIVPWQFDRGQYAYVVGGRDGKLRYIDANGSQYETGPKDSKPTLVKRGDGDDPAAHPLREIRIVAQRLVREQRETTTLPRQAADAELRYIKQQQEKDSSFESNFGAKASPQQIADGMGAVLGNPQADAHAVVKALYMGMKSKPIEGEGDPRLTVLRVALKDGHELVRLAAAQLLKDSPVGYDKQAAAFTAADISKNSSSGGSGREASELLADWRKSDERLVERALAETPYRPRTERGGEREDGSSVTRDVKFQRAFEKIRRSLLEGKQEILTWDWQQWNDFCAKQNLNLLTWNGLHSAQREAAALTDQNRGSLREFFMSKAEIEKEREEARQSVIPKMWRQLDELVEKAMQKGDLDPDGIAARQALAFLVMSNAREVSTSEKQKVVDKAVDAIRDICKGQGPGRGDMEWVLRTLLTEKPDLTAAQKTKLLEALDALSSEDKGKISRENAAGIVTLALEQEMRFMPRPGQAGYPESVEYQKKLLSVLEKYGNRDLGPALGLIAKEHADQSVRERALAVKEAIEKRASAGVERLVSQMISDTQGTSQFASIRDARDPRLPVLLTALNDGKLPAEQRVRAAEILMAPENKGVKATDRQAATRVYVELALRQSDDRRRYQAAETILDHSNPLFIAAQREKAAAAMAEISVTSANPDSQERALLAVEKLKGSEAAQAIKAILDACGKLSRDSGDYKERVGKAMEAVAGAYARSSKDAGAQALLLQAAQSSQIWLGADHPATKRLNETVKETLRKVDSEQSRITSDRDPRIAPLRAALASEDAEIKYYAALALSDAGSTGVPKEVAEEARRVIYWRLDEMIFAARRLEVDRADKKDIEAAWRNIESVLTRIGENQDDYGRTYVQAKRLELAGGREKELIPLYERLAKISEERQAPEAARLYRQKAERARDEVAGGPALKAADTAFGTARTDASDALALGDKTKLAQAEKKLKECVEAYKKAAGERSLKTADALTELARVYAAQGKMNEAAAASRQAVSIYEGHGGDSTPHRIAALGTWARATYGQPSMEGEFKEVKTKLLAATNHGPGETVPVSDGEVLRDLVDYMLSKGAIDEDALADAEQMMQRATEARLAAFAWGSPEAAEGAEKMASFYMQTGQALKAQDHLRQASLMYSQRPGMEAKVGDAQAKLAEAIARTGDYEGAHAAYEQGIIAMTKPGASVPTPVVEAHFEGYIRMLQEHGRMDLATQWRRRALRYRNTGVMPPVVPGSGGF